MAQPLQICESKMFQPLQVMIEHRIPELEIKFLEKPVLLTMLDHASRDMIFKLKAYVLSNRTEEKPSLFRVHGNVEFTYSEPSSWWQHLKQDLFPKWALKRFPVRMVDKKEQRRVTLKAMQTLVTNYYCCPHANIPWNGRDAKIHIDFLEGKPWTEPS